MIATRFQEQQTRAQRGGVGVVGWGGIISIKRYQTGGARSTPLLQRGGGLVARGPNTQGACDKRPCMSGSARTRLQSANYHSISRCVHHAMIAHFAMRAVQLESEGVERLDLSTPLDSTSQHILPPL